jgi:hypothetical protein
LRLCGGPWLDTKLSTVQRPLPGTMTALLLSMLFEPRVSNDSAFVALSP